MIIERDIGQRIVGDRGAYIQILIGPRQCGKSTLLSTLSGDVFSEVTFDDLQLRTVANDDPAMFMAQHPCPLIIDEVQYAPNIFPELKRIVDEIKRQRLLDNQQSGSDVLFRLTGSNQILLDKHVKESLVGRALYYSLNTLTVHEIMKALPASDIFDVIFKGGWPELYINPALSITHYLNDYIRLYIEKDIVLSAGVSKQREFNTVLAMLAARTGGFINYSSISKDSGVRSITVKEWVSVLQRSNLIYLLPPRENNLNKRVVKTPKLYFLDTGLAVRLQGWSEKEPLLNSPQIGGLFETLVFCEIIKLIQNFGKDWKLSVWRTREGEEIDFVIDISPEKVIALDAKLGIHKIRQQSLPESFSKYVPQAKELILVTVGGNVKRLSDSCVQVPIAELTEYLLQV